MGNTIKHTHKINVLIVGATGKLGALVTRHALKQRNLSVTILVRDVEKAKDLVNEVKSAGGKVIQGDLSKPETLVDSTRGIHTVISCSAVYQDSDAEAQLNLLRDAVKNGVKRFVSSNFGINYEHVTPGNVLIDAKLKLDREIAKTNVKLISVTTGFITDFILPMNAQGLRYYGDVNQKLDLTTYDDIAKFVTAIVTRPKKSGTFNLRGEELSTKEIADIYNRVRGASIKPQSGGSIEELRQQVEQKKREGDHINAAFLNLFELAYSGKGKIQRVDNDKFPKVKITSLEQFLRQNPSVTIAGETTTQASQKINVLIVGATGKLGELVTRHALKNPNITVTILVRDLNKAKDLVNEVKNAGGKVIQGDLSKPETLVDSTKDIHTVISTSSVFQDSDAEAQINLLNDAVKNGVKRFVSSNFGINYEHATPGNVLIDAKLKFDRAVAKTNIKLISITTGFITDFLLPMNAQGLRYYGDIDQKLDLTSYDDIARYVITIVGDSEKSGSFNVSGEEISTRELADVYNKVRGASIQPQSGGSIEELRQQIQQKKNEGDHINAAFLGLFELAYSGKGKIQRKDNSQFSQVKPISVAEFLKQNPTITVA